MKRRHGRSGAGAEEARPEEGGLEVADFHGDDFLHEVQEHRLPTGGNGKPVGSEARSPEFERRHRQSRQDHALERRNGCSERHNAGVDVNLQVLEHRPADEVLEANRPCGAHSGLGRDVGRQDRRHARDDESATDIHGRHDGKAKGDIRDLDSDAAGIGETGNSRHRRNGHAGEAGQSAAADFDRVEIVSECVDLEGAKDAGIGLGPLDLSAETEGQRAAQLEEAVHLKDRLAHFRRDDLHGFGGIEEDKRAAGRGETVAAGGGKRLGEIDRGQRGCDLVPEETEPAIAGDGDILE